MSRAPQRQYSPRALENWLNRLLRPWEQVFSDRELARGREIYRGDDVRSLELTDELAIFHGGRARDDIYAVVEWKDDAFQVRHSIPDKLEGRALAAAGLYELEELLAEEVDPLPLAEAPSAKPASASAPRQTDDSRPIRAKAEPPPRKLAVGLTLTTRGIRLEAFWQMPGKPRENAFGGGAMTPREREMLIRLTSRARRAHFAPQKGEREYLLKDPQQMTAFVTKELPQWRSFFQVDADPRMRHLAGGMRTVDLTLKVGGSAKGLQFSWEGRDRGQQLAEDEILPLIRNPRQAVLVPDRGLVRLSDETARRVADWGPLFEQGQGMGFPRYMLFSFLAQGTIPVEASSEIEAWRKKVEQDDQRPELSVPSFLRPYQVCGVRWLERLLGTGCHPLLADEMGLGKTVQILALIALHWAREPISSVIVCPASVVPVWQGEAEKFFPHLPLRVLRGDDNFVDHQQPTIWIASYTQLRRHRPLLEQVSFGFAVLDEAQMIKNPDAKVTQACLNLRATHRLAMTGTPLENRHLDLWTIFRFLMPGFLGSRRRLESVLQSFGEHEVGAMLRRQLAPFMLRRTKAEVVAELPAKVEMTLHCPLTAVQLNEYRRLAETGEAEFGNDVASAMRRRAIPFLSLLTRLRQVCCDPGLLPWRRDDPLQSGKIVALVERLEEIVSSGQKVVVFSQFVRLLERLDGVLAERFPELPRFKLTGATTNRRAPVDGFQKTKGAGIILVSLKAGGTGITLNTAEYVFLLDPWWNPAVEAQAIDRVHRIGQQRRVFVYRLVTRGTIEARIEALKSHKRDLFDQLVQGLDSEAAWIDQFARMSDLLSYRDDSLEVVST